MRSTIEAVYKETRRSGNTTRKVDKAIDILMNDGEVLCEVHDKEIGGRSKKVAVFELFEKIKKRLKNEHKGFEVLANPDTFVLKLIEK